MKAILILGVVTLSFTLKSMAAPLTNLAGLKPKEGISMAVSCGVLPPPIDADHTLLVSVKVDGLWTEAARVESFIRNKLGRRTDDGQTVMFQDAGAVFVLHVSLSSTQNTDGRSPKITLSVSATNQTPQLQKANSSTETAASAELH